MSPRRGGAALLLALAACEPVLSRSAALEGRSCREQACVSGYACQQGVCVLAALAETAATGSSSRLDSDPEVRAIGGGSNGGNGGAAGVEPGAAAGSNGSTGDTGSPRTAGSAGNQEPSLDAGSAEADSLDAATAGDTGCVAQTLFRDRDGDGFGSDDEQSFGCPTPGWVTRGGDCHDVFAGTFDAPEAVHPGQTAYFFVGYTDPSKPRGISFDYDCSLAEDVDPSNTPLALAQDCTQLGNACGGSGFVPDARSGPGIDSRCGSEIVSSCASSGPGQCTAQETATAQPFRCR